MPTGRRNSGGDDYYTSQWIFDGLGLEFDLDPCSPIVGGVVPARTKYTIEDDGLSHDWFGLVWMNPPYGSKNQGWYKKFLAHGNGLAFLTIAQMSTNKFTEIIPGIDGLLIYHKRVHLIDGTTGKRRNSPGGSVLVAMGTKAIQAINKSNLGTVWVKNK